MDPQYGPPIWTPILDPYTNMNPQYGPPLWTPIMDPHYGPLFFALHFYALVMTWECLNPI
jgi:hypothetical protein